MQDLPQQPTDYEVVIPLEEEKTTGIIQDELEFQFIETPTPPMVKLEEKDLFILAHFLHQKYEKGFTWAELSQIIEIVTLYIGPNPEMSLAEKRKACVDVIHYLMVTIDALYLPEKATDPFFEMLIGPYVKLALTFPTERALIIPSREKPLTEANLIDYMFQIKGHFEEGLKWKDLALATRYAFSYILSYKDLTQQDQIDGTYAIIGSLIDETSPDALPPYFDEKLYKIFILSYIEISYGKKG